MPRPTVGLIVAISLTLAGCSTPTGPEAPPVNLAHTDAEGLSLLKVQLCHRDGDAPSSSFGTGVAPGTRLSGTFTFDPGTLPTPTFDPNRVRYVGVTVQFTVGSETVSGNDPTQAAIEIYNGPPGGDSYSLIVGGGFSSGTIAGRSIDQFVWVVSGTSALFSDTSLPLTPGFFGPNLGTRVCIGECFAGTILEGDITTLTLVP